MNKKGAVTEEILDSSFYMENSVQIEVLVVRTNHRKARLSSTCAHLFLFIY